MNATKIAHRRHVERGIPQRDDMHGIGHAVGEIHVADDACFKPGGAQFDDALQRIKFWQFKLEHSCQWNRSGKLTASPASLASHAQDLHLLPRSASLFRTDTKLS